MREILFKGKKKDNGEWIEGYLLDGGMPGYKTTGKVNRGIMNMGLYYKKERNAEDNGWLHHWSMLPRKEEGYVPMKECVRPDNTVQGWMLHPKHL